MIYNPFAGKFNRNRGQLLQRTIDTLKDHGHSITALPTTGPRSASLIARDCIAKGADVIIAAGGDGTINEVTNGMARSPVPLAIIPAGTANVLAVELGLGTNLSRAAAMLRDCVPACISLGRLDKPDQQRYFVLMAGAGLDAMIVYNIDAKLKATLGKVAYWVGGFSQIGRPLPEFDVTTNGTTIRCSFALASRVRNYGGDLWIARGASLFSNHFEVVLFQGAHSIPYVKYLIGVVSGKLAGMSGVSVLQVQELLIESPNGPGIYIQIDGEFVGALPARLQIVPAALTLLVPPAFYNKHANG
ncbi:MAG: diacylglycerol kinase family protein [Bryobacteraceae bacterium]